MKRTPFVAVVSVVTVANADQGLIVVSKSLVLVATQTLSM